MSIPVITISREYGSGGRAIGEKLAKELGIPFYNKELILMAAKESGLSEEYIKKGRAAEVHQLPLRPGYMGAQQLPMNDQIFLIQSKIIREIAEKGPCVIVGRCADYVLRERKDLLSVFIHAPLSFRAQRAQKVYEKTASNIEEIKARGGKVITVIAKGDEQVRKSSDYFIEVPVVAECLMPIVVSVPLQLLAYHIAVNKGRDVDQPRNLAKSVTVE